MTCCLNQATGLMIMAAMRGNCAAVENAELIEKIRSYYGLE
jgi:hypothetical protein